jgi:type II secretory pathway pseudopilin PulG
MMLAIVLMGLVLSVAARQWKMAVQREQEIDLLVKGIEIQNALAAYSVAVKAGRVTQEEYYPATLVELTRPPRPLLRKAYPDPMTGGDWELLRSPGGGIMGVRSRSKAFAIKRSDFPQAVRHFEGLSRYNEWVFQHPNPSSTGTGVPAAPPGGAAPGPASP